MMMKFLIFINKKKVLATCYQTLSSRVAYAITTYAQGKHLNILKLQSIKNARNCCIVRANIFALPLMIKV